MNKPQLLAEASAWGFYIILLFNHYYSKKIYKLKLILVNK